MHAYIHIGIPSSISLLTLDVMELRELTLRKTTRAKDFQFIRFPLPERTKEKSKEGADNTIIESRTCLLTSSRRVLPVSRSFSLSLCPTFFSLSHLPSFLAFLSLHLVLSTRYVPVTRSDNNALLSPLFQNSLLGVEALCTRHLY